MRGYSNKLEYWATRIRDVGDTIGAAKCGLDIRYQEQLLRQSVTDGTEANEAGATSVTRLSLLGNLGNF